MDPKDIRILVVDDELSVRDSLYKWFRADGFKVDTARDGVEALHKLEGADWDIILIDIKMPGMDGMELQQRVKAARPDATIIIMTAYASVDTAVKALKEGAYDYIMKPFDPDELSHLLQNAIRQKGLLAENVLLRRKIDELSMYDEIIGESPGLKDVMQTIKTVAATDVTVLIQGESGTGKELFARAVHSNSPRRYAPFIPLNCGALPETLLESELFGHEKGAFTGAQYRRKGKIEMAHGGTIFFDEIGDISQKTQIDLLRVIETKQFARLGGNETIKVDFRIICASNKDLKKAVDEGRFREDLYYRINVFSIYLPPLRERQTDIPLLAEHFVKKFSITMNKNVKGISEEAMQIITRYSWPGNVRELENAMERAMVVSKDQMIRPQDLPIWNVSKTPQGDDDSLDEAVKRHVKRILDENNWNMARTAQILKIDRVTLYNKVKKYGFEKGS